MIDAHLLGQPLSDGVVLLRRPAATDVSTIETYIARDDSQSWLSAIGDAHALYAEFEAGWVEPPRPNRFGLTLIIESVPDGVLVGVMHLDDRAGPRLDVSYGVSPDHRRTGIASRALALVTLWARSNGFSSVELEIGDDNVASQGVARRCGFVRSGRRRSQRTEDGSLWRASAWTRDLSANATTSSA